MSNAETERAVFRLLLVIAFLTLFGAGGAAAINYRRLVRYETSGRLYYQSYERNERLCADSVEARERPPRPRAPGEGEVETFLKRSPCDVDALRELRQATMSHIGPMNESRDAFSRYATIVLLVPLLSMALFYVGRWTLTGRLRPIWPLGKNADQPRP